MISGDPATLLLPGVLTVLLYAAVLFYLVARRRALAGPRPPSRPADTAPPRAPPRLRLVVGGRASAPREEPREKGPASG